MPVILSPEFAPQVRLSTAEEFLDWLQPGKHADLIDGETFMHSPVNLRHARLLNFVDHRLRSYIEQKKLGELFREVVAVKLDGRNVFLPDLAYFTPEQSARLGASFVTEIPALVVEVLSPSTAERDSGVKFATYEQAGVREYWLLDPEKMQHRFFRLAGENYGEILPNEGIMHSDAVPGLHLRLDWLNPETLPETAACLAEISAN